jgi:hypothetical protein
MEMFEKWAKSADLPQTRDPSDVVDIGLQDVHNAHFDQLAAPVRGDQSLAGGANCEARFETGSRMEKSRSSVISNFGFAPGTAAATYAASTPESRARR